MSTMAMPMKNTPHWFGKIDRKPGIPPTPMDEARTWFTVSSIPAIAEPIIPKMNG
ncbi:hypothetical protein D3C73_1354680 [compost metagenome]